MLKSALFLFTLAYPWIWHYGGQPRALAFFMSLVWGVRAVLERQPPARLGAFCAALLFAALTLWHNALVMRLYPLLVNGAVLAVFILGEIRPPSVIERLARRQDPELSPAALRYIRRLNRIWIAFLLMNGLIIAALSTPEREREWTLYTGAISYLLIGLLLGGEWLYRRCTLR